MATVDTDIWVDLPVRQYVRILTIAQRIGARILSGNVLGLRDDQRVDFIYKIDGLASFNTEWKRATSLTWAGLDVKVLPLARVIRSKEISNRPVLGSICILVVIFCGERLRKNVILCRPTSRRLNARGFFVFGLPVGFRHLDDHFQRPAVILDSCGLRGRLAV